MIYIIFNNLLIHYIFKFVFWLRLSLFHCACFGSRLSWMNFDMLYILRDMINLVLPFRYIHWTLLVAMFVHRCRCQTHWLLLSPIMNENNTSFVESWLNVWTHTHIQNVYHIPHCICVIYKNIFLIWMKKKMFIEKFAKPLLGTSTIKYGFM